MKKHLIAAAVAGAFAVPAMAQVTVSGLLDAALISNDKTVSMATGTTTQVTTKTSETGMTSGQGWGTSELRFSGTEDLGGGLRASFQFNSDLRTQGTTSGTASSSNSVFGSRDRWVALSGGFGTVRLGSQGNVGNSAGFNAYTQLGTTARGSIYSLAVQGGPTGTANAGLNIPPGSQSNDTIERQNNVVNYISPTMNGFTLLAGTARNSSDRDDRGGKANGQQDGFSVTYVAGPLSAGAGITDRKVELEGTDLPGAGRAVTKIKANFVGASYNFGVATLGGTVIKNKSKNDLTNANLRDLTLNVVGVTLPLGATTLRATVYNGTDKVSVATTDDIKHNGYQLSAVYALSKRTSAYVFAGKNETKRAGGNTNTGAVSKVTGTRAGITHSF